MFTKVGSRASEFNVGDEVIAITGKQIGGRTSSQVNVSTTHAVRKPSNITFEEACSMPIVFGTVHYAFELGKLALKEHVLIQTATGGCGLIAIQLANLKDCVCYGTSSRQEKMDILSQLGVSHVINYKTGEFDKEIRRITNNRGVDLVLNTLAGDGIQKGLNCLAPYGRYMEIAVHTLKTSAKLDLSRLVQNQSIHSIDLRKFWSLEEGFSAKEMLNSMVSLLQAEKIVPIVSRIYPIHQIKEGLEYVAQGQHIGKVVISHTSQNMIDLTDQCMQRLQEQKRNAKKHIAAPKVVSLAMPENKNGESKQPESPEAIAIIGMSGQFPKANNLMKFWDNLVQGKDCISEIPEMRWSIDEHYSQDPKVPGKTYSKWMGALEDVDKLDPFFLVFHPLKQN